MALFAAAGALATHHPGLLLATLPEFVAAVLLFPTERRFEEFLARGGVDLSALNREQEEAAKTAVTAQSVTDRDLVRLARTLGSGSVSFGVMFLLLGVLFLAIFSSLVREMIAENQWDEVGSLLLFVGLPLLVLLGGGASLVLGGLRFRKHEDSGRRLLIGAFATCFVAIATSLGLQIAGTAVAQDISLWGRLLGVGHQLLLLGAVLYLLWRGIRFLRSPRVVDLCSSDAEAGNRNEDQRP